MDIIFNLEDRGVQILEKIGIDAGGSLIKIVYKEKGKLHYKKYTINESENLSQWLQFIAPTAKIYLTGGKSLSLKEKYIKNATVVDEFTSMATGSRYLLQMEGNQEQEDYILISIGTGTSIYHITNTSFERLLGTGIGGGTFLGLGYLLTGDKDFHSLIEKAEVGNRVNGDLLVQDIYGIENTLLTGELTAANFGKAHLSREGTSNDFLANVIQMIAETCFLLASQAAIRKNINKLMFVGSTLEGNRLLKQKLIQFGHTADLKVTIPIAGSYCGALGAYLLE